MTSLATGRTMHPLVPVAGLHGRAALKALEAALKTMPGGEAPVEHTFAPGVYARTMFIPAGTVLTGKIHKHAHLNFLLQGELDVLTENGMQHMKAPMMFVSAAGTKRGGYAHTDVVWVTVHPTESTDLEEIEREVIAPDFEEYDASQGVYEGEVIE